MQIYTINPLTKKFKKKSNSETKKIAAELKIDDRIHKQQAFIKFKDHRANFLNDAQMPIT